MAETELLANLLVLALVAVQIAGMWKIFEKAGEPGWASVVPFYNAYLLIKIAERPGWWFILYFVPLAALVPAIMVPVDIAKKFDKGTGFGVGMVFLPFIFFPLLGFSDAKYTPESASPEAEGESVAETAEP